MKTLKKSKVKNVKKAMQILNLNELLHIRGGDGEVTFKDGEIN